MKNMAKNILALAVLLCICLPMKAQDPKGNRPERPSKPTPEQMLEQKCMKLIQQLGLDDKQAEKFTVTYKAYRADCDKVRQKYHPKPEPTAAAPKDKKIKTDKEIDQAMKDRLAEQRAILDLQEKYFAQFRTFLSARQTEKLFKKECKHHDKDSRHGKKRGKGKGNRKGMTFHPNSPMHESHHQPPQQQ